MQPKCFRLGGEGGGLALSCNRLTTSSIFFKPHRCRDSSDGNSSQLWSRLKYLSESRIEYHIFFLPCFYLYHFSSAEDKFPGDPWIFFFWDTISRSSSRSMKYLKVPDGCVLNAFMVIRWCILVISELIITDENS